MSTCTHLQHNLITFDQFNFANGDVRVHPEKSTQLWRQFVKGESYFDGGIFGCHVRNELGSLCTWSFPLFVFSLSLIRTGCDIRAAVKYLLQTRLTLRACGLQWREITDGIRVEFLSASSLPHKKESGYRQLSVWSQLCHFIKALPFLVFSDWGVMKTLPNKLGL